MTVHSVFPGHRSMLIAGVFAMTANAAQANEKVTLDDGTTCTVITGTTSTGGETSTTVTAGGGGVSSSTSVDGKTAMANSAGSSSSSSSASSATSDSVGGQSYSMATATRPDGSVITRRSDGTCDVTKPTR